MTKPANENDAQWSPAKRRQRTQALRAHGEAHTAGDRDPDPPIAPPPQLPPEPQPPPQMQMPPSQPAPQPLKEPSTTDPRPDTGEGSPVAPRPEPETRDWALLLFMKPDAPLEAEVSADLKELKAAPALTTAYAGVQVERLTDVERMQIEGDGKSRLHPSPPRGVGGMAEAVADFSAWTLRAFPAARRLAVMWGHASGVGFDLAIPEDQPDEDPFLPWKPGPHPPAGKKSARPEDPHQFTIRTLVTCVEKMRVPVSESTPPGYVPPSRLDILGLDSCYMSSVECGYELREHVDYLVASESFMLNQGWNYRTVLSLVASGQPAPDAVGRAIVEHVTTLPGDGSLSMLTLSGMTSLAAAFKTLVEALSVRINDPIEREALKIVLGRVAYMKVRQFLDVRDLCHKLIQHFDGDVAAAAANLLSLLKEELLFHRANGRALGRLNGLSIFYPYVRARRMRTRRDDDDEVNAVVEPETYRNLAFVKDTKWGDLLDRLFGL